MRPAELVTLVGQPEVSRIAVRDRLADDLFDLFLGTGSPAVILGPFFFLINALAADFPSQHNKLCRRQCFAGHARFGVL